MLWLLSTYRVGGTILCSSKEKQSPCFDKTLILLEKNRITTNENVGQVIIRPRKQSDGKEDVFLRLNSVSAT